MPLKLEKFDKLLPYKDKTPATSTIILCGCGARNLKDAKRCWKCHKSFEPIRCPILPNHGTRKFGRCKRFTFCQFRDDARCPATGDVFG